MNQNDHICNWCNENITFHCTSITKLLRIELIQIQHFAQFHSSFGFQLIDQMKNKAMRLLIFITIIFLILLNFRDFTNDYWYEYPQRISGEFVRPIHKVFDKANELSKNNQYENIRFPKCEGNSLADVHDKYFGFALPFPPNE